MIDLENANMKHPENLRYNKKTKIKNNRNRRNRISGQIPNLKTDMTITYK